MNISIFGLGYVGMINSACLAKLGHFVIGVDIKKEKVNKVNNGISTVYESELAKNVKKMVHEQKLVATTDVNYAIQNTDLSLICVGTPSDINGNLNKSALLRVSKELGQALKQKKSQHIFIYRSTMLPGTTEEMTKIIEFESKKTLNKGFFVGMNPEFLREGQAMYDFFHPEKIVIGNDNVIVREAVEELYDDIDAKFFSVPIKVAESVKYADNLFHALKICFANEIDSFCDSNNVNGIKVMAIFKADKKLNISETYLNPGFCYGGSCLPKDIKAVLGFANLQKLNLPLINSILLSNEQRYFITKQKLDNVIDKYNNPTIGFLGVAFKGMTDDLRNSKVVDMIKEYKKYFNIALYDDFVSKDELVKIFGDKCQYALDINNLINKSDIIVYNNTMFKRELYMNINETHSILDLNQSLNKDNIRGNYVK